MVQLSTYCQQSGTYGSVTLFVGVDIGSIFSAERRSRDCEIYHACCPGRSRPENILQVEYSRSYPGLKTVYNIHTVKCRVKVPRLPSV